MFTEQIEDERESTPATPRRILYFLLPLLLIVGALIAYKSSAAVTVIGKVSATGVFKPRANVIPNVGPSAAGVFTRTLNYFLVIWPALLFGILISGAVSTFVPSRWLSLLPVPQLTYRRSLRLCVRRIGESRLSLRCLFGLWLLVLEFL